VVCDAPLTRIPGSRLLFCGHTDVVPTGDRSHWTFDPFSGEVRAGMLLGRGATDMKGGLASLIFVAGLPVTCVISPSASMPLASSMPSTSFAYSVPSDFVRPSTVTIVFMVSVAPSLNSVLASVLKVREAPFWPTVKLKELPLTAVITPVVSSSSPSS